MSLQARATPPPAAGHDPKSVVRRLIEDVLNDGRLDVVDELYTPPLAALDRTVARQLP